MSGLRNDVIAFLVATARVSRKPKALATLATLCLSLCAISCGTISTSQQTPSAGQAVKPAAEQGSKLTVDQVGDALTSYGKNTSNDNGQVVYSITVPRGKWNINVLINLSPNGNVIWMTNDLTPLPDGGKASAAALADLLKKNRDIGPMFFEVSDGSVAMTYPVPNHDLTEASFKATVEAFISTVVDNAQLWDPATIAAK
jgi:hypothetical protein